MLTRGECSFFALVHYMHARKAQPMTPEHDIMLCPSIDPTPQSNSISTFHLDIRDILLSFWLCQLLQQETPFEVVIRMD